jgi:chromosome segregation ATPase
MDDAERQRTMDFILRQQAQFSAGIQRNEEQMTTFRRVVVMMARQFRKERSDLKERVAALIDAQIKSEEKQSRLADAQVNSEERQARSGEWQAQMEKSFARSDARMTRLEADAERTRRDLNSLKYAVESHDDDINALFLINKSNSEAIAKLTDVVAKQGRRRNGGEELA